ncbi:nucleotidyl transferase AbiEii/AbiGii toxin family protein [Gemmobacter serpentinus]|uniref:nucleotidyl transferase AbiEii/AbiGii toxin family protein n=1 Tax=Gemmobacter serpentinus TaxID=2652247 RepID=UPI001CF64AC2|nr:nucleotidyl transferase AbiEii/AbiGii toxin family protein [Gemmobacter serpentinus]
MNTPLPSRWPELFDMAMAIIDQANAQGIGMNSWSFGGGTALMLQINHRESHDIDLFIEDAQYLPYLNPETQDYDLALAPSDYETDGTRALKIVFEGVGEIDFICCDPVTETPFTKAEIRGRNVRLETPAEILAKKVVFRGSQLQPRDMFDIAAVAQAIGTDYVVEACSRFPDACREALRVTENMNPKLVEAVTEKLLVSEGFLGLQGRAQMIATEILTAAITRSAALLQ